VIAESVHNHNYKFLWDILFERHPEGSYGKGLWDAQGDKKTEVPGLKILLEMFKRHPTVLILDEFQTWEAGLVHGPGPHPRLAILDGAEVGVVEDVASLAVLPLEGAIFD
jgi:hypothetical protein